MLGNLNLISYQWFKSNSPFAPVRCWNDGYDFRPNFTHLSSMSEKHILDYIDRIYIYSMSTQQFLWLDVTEEVCLQILSRKSDLRDSGLAGAVRTRIIFVTSGKKKPLVKRENCLLGCNNISNFSRYQEIRLSCWIKSHLKSVSINVSRLTLDAKVGLLNPRYNFFFLKHPFKQKDKKILSYQESFHVFGKWLIYSRLVSHERQLL